MNNQKVRDSFKVILLVFWVAMIFFFSSQPGFLPSTEYYEHVVRKLGHFSVFAILIFLLYKALSLLRHKSLRQNLSLALAISMLYAATDEIHQLSVAGRGGSARDVVIDFFGIIVAAWLIILEKEHQERYPQKKHLIKI